MRIVVKFGGTSVQDTVRIKKAAQSIIQQAKKGYEVVAVVSAMGNTTDTLTSLLKNSVKDRIEDRDYADFVSMGERISARILSATIKSMGFTSKYFDPADDNFPIITDSNFNQAKILSPESKEKCQKIIEPLLKKGIIPIVCGFLGKNCEDGSITTLGRGGSDITAFALGNFLQADEVIIVTDAVGVLSADPRIIKKPVTLKEISVEEMGILAEGGAKVLHPQALKYKTDQMKAKIIHFQNGDLETEGTEITGAFKSKLTLFKEKLTMLTILGSEIFDTPGLLKKIISPISDNLISLYGVSIGTKHIGIYVIQNYAQKSYDLIHPVVIEDERLKSVTLKKDIALIIVRSRDFIETPGIIQQITQPLANKDINIIEMTTIKTDILIFLDWKDREFAFQIINKSLAEAGIVITNN
ncbi:MAG: aspartate kinase [Candidatus Infernicultor aquiphilus]|uniref:Aspartokinase n=1 Tax=Candidatus Infernicultor aquiphilus TaxID=1805029 RepID=A0A2M7PMG0_9BACT|nr:MAG: aspartate kinase [Candidatus Atribacteria bacterium CG_4_10_14_3_um_filter_34_13]